MKQKFLGLGLLVCGVLMILGGLAAEVAWLTFCFGTVIIGILLLVFSPAILFLPFTMVTLAGTAFWGTGLALLLDTENLQGRGRAPKAAPQPALAQPQPPVVVSEDSKRRAQRDFPYAAQEAAARASAQSTGVAPVGALLLLLGGGGLVMAFIAAISQPRSTPPAPAPIAATAPVPVSAPASAPAPTMVSRAVAGMKANVLATPAENGKVLRVLDRGALVEWISDKGDFAQVQTSEGETGFISRPLLISSADAKRLGAISAFQYEGDGKRMKSMPEGDAFFRETVAAISAQSPEINSYLTKLQERAASYVPSTAPDTAAANWFVLAAMDARAKGQDQEALAASRAAAEANPSSGSALYMLAVTSYRLGLFELSSVPSGMLPRVSPRDSRAWMAYAIARTLEKDPDQELAKYTLILSLRLADDPVEFRGFIEAFIRNAAIEPTKRIFRDALEEARQRPDLFADAAPPRSTPAQSNSELRP
jgi:hypothetical protein